MTICAPQAEAGHWAGLAAEAAIEHLVKEMAHGLAPGRIRVNGVLADSGVDAVALGPLLASLSHQRGINGAVIPLSHLPVAQPKEGGT